MTLIALDGSGSRAIGQGSGATYSPSGKHILFRGGDAEAIALWRMNADGSGKTPVGGGPTQWADTPFTWRNKIVWSPEGDLGIYGVFSDAYTAQLRGVSPDGTNDRAVMDVGNWGDDVQFSPDGARLLAVTATTSGNEVSVVDLTTMKTTRLKGGDLSSGGHISAAAWLPVGSGFVGTFTGVKQPSFTFTGTDDGLTGYVDFGSGTSLDGPPLWSAAGDQLYWPLRPSRSADSELWRFTH
jgi:hypothetical protein